MAHTGTTPTTSTAPRAPSTPTVAGTRPEPEPRGRLIGDLRTVRLLWHREMIRVGRNRLQVVMGLLAPLMFLLVLGSGLESASSGMEQFRLFLFPGVLMMALQAPAITVGASIVWDRQSGFLRQMLVAPVRRGAILSGICLGGGATGAFYGLLVLLTGPVVGVPFHPKLLLVLLELGLIAFAFTAFGALAAVYVRKPQTFQVAISMSMMPLLFLSGAVFPPSGLPGWLGGAVMVNPLTYAVDAIRRTLPGERSSFGGALSPDWWGWTPPVALEVGLVAALAALTLTVATRRFAR
ncbi:ABC transporter permease [Streptomyces iconiensis]|uniref:Transport permease protein n=1 Tax=Streptomyces iconiensis TaxID=1384038 RepID=A0ABT7A1M8_9ACTN|nr:ABC transporter permease [Streptomyces iconiensis]MDJ1135243.1 ABC transporter permease [Streptomyces iconiensis]